jgi:pilus assembly protein FimV
MGFLRRMIRGLGMKMSVFTSIHVMGALGLLAAMPAYALGLGKIELSSALNEPFRAEIPVNAVAGNEAETLQVRLASNEEFERAGLVKNAAITQLKFKVIQKAGKTVITVTSKNAVKEPLLDFLLLAKSSNGQLIREYTVLLDPPKSVFNQAVRAAKVVTPPKRSQPRKVVSQPVQPRRVQAIEPQRSTTSASQYGPTSNTDTLWDVALKTRPTRDVSVHQMMMALVDKNARAFIKNNINGLKRGYTLSIPTSAEIGRLTQQQAVASVRQQNAAWKNRHAAPKAVVETATSQVIDETAPEQTVEQAVEESANAASTAEPTARLQLLGSNEEKLLSENNLAAFGNEDVKALSEQLTIAQEVIEGQQQENVNIKARMAAMEEQIQTLRKLISLQDPDLARLQSKLEQESAAQASDTLAEMTAILNDSQIESLAMEESIADESVAVSPYDLVAEESSVVDEVQEKTEEVAPIETETADLAQAEDSNETTEAVITEAPSATLFDKVQAFLIKHKMTAILAGLAFLLGLLFLNRKKAEDSRKTWDEAMEKVDNQGSQSATAKIVPPLTPVVKDVEPAAEPVKVVDELISDADVYVNYGDFDKAEQVLIEAYDSEPANLLVIQKLLFTYYKQGKTTAFSELARQYLVDKESMEWAEVAEWGRELDSQNSLFDQQPVVEESVVDLAELDAVLEFDVAADVDDAASKESDDLLDFTTDIDVDETKISDMESDDDAAVTFNTISSDLDLSLSDNDNDFEIEGLGLVSENELEAATSALSGNNGNDGDLEFDLTDFELIDEAETKLDLASAYIDMGDPEGAKTILQEIISEGNDAQKTRAEKLLNDLQ